RALAQQGDLVQQLHSVVAQIRTSYMEGSPRSDFSRLDPEVRRLWDQRHVILNSQTSQHNWSRAQVKDDLVELAIFWAESHLRRASEEDRQQAAREGLEVLLYVERLGGSRFVLCQKQAELAAVLGNREILAQATVKLESLKPVSAWEHYALGRSSFAARDFAEAEAHFKAAVESRPKELSYNFYQGRAAFELARFDEAATAFAICVALADQVPLCHYRRGLAMMRLGRNELARRDFDRALELNPLQTQAAIERGMLSCQEQRYDDAISDFERAKANGAGAGSIAYGLALAYAAKGDRATALRHLDELFAVQPDHAEGQKLAQSLGSASE
ncbi:MAG TPA: tetratricopeptide repeat protein, partial [Pirellulales bacterium]|nr:tetratricopeptide repeat protein [Pirellulales bacterium]